MTLLLSRFFELIVVEETVWKVSDRRTRECRQFGALAADGRRRRRAVVDLILFKLRDQSECGRRYRSFVREFEAKARRQRARGVCMTQSFLSSNQLLLIGLRIDVCIPQISRLTD